MNRAEREMVVKSQDKAMWPVFYRMTKRGMLVDLDRMAALRTTVVEQRDEQEALIEEFAGEPVDPNSPKAIGTWMRKEGLSTGKVNKDGLPSTGERELKMVGHPACDAIVEYRGLNKLVNTFIDPTVEIARRDPVSHTLGRVHPRWRLTVVKTGRVAMEDPNLLAFPTRDAMGKRVRECFVPHPGNAMVSIDYSQLEPRIVAGLSQDPKLMRVYQEERDLYTEVANDLTVTRTVAKTLTLGILYGMGARSLYERLLAVGVVNPDGSPVYDVDGCQYLIDKWFATYAGVPTLIQAVLAEARENDGNATTLMGRERSLPGLFVTGNGWPCGYIREEAERQAFNHRIQGTGMEFLKRSAIRIDAEEKRFQLLLLIHDEAVGEVPEHCIDAVVARAQCLMGEWAEVGGIPLVTKASVGDSWGALK